MTVSDSQFQAVVKLADEYLARVRRGERPNVTEYLDRYPHLAEGLREVLPMTAAMEDLASDVRPRGPAAPGAASAVASHPVQPLARLADYRIVREIGRGGMGIVYEAEHIRLGRHVALKVLHAGGSLAAGQRRRFELEARAAARLHHTNIIPVFDVGEHDGTTFYAMQFIRGQGLDKIVEQLRQIWEPGSANGNTIPTLPPESPVARLVFRPARPESEYWRSVARLGVQVADALQYAHAQGILHRDVKPSNLVLDECGVVWVADFGLARLEDEAGLTQSGEFVGTLRYMAPERFEGRCDPRSDVYSLGLALYELATFRPAFGASSRHQLIQQVTQQEPPRPRSVNPAIPRDLETILLKAIAREPSRRYQSAGELAADLLRFVEDKPIAARRSGIFERAVRWSKRKPLLAALLTAVVLSTVAGTAGIAWQWRQAESARDAALRLAAGERLALDEKTRALDDAERAKRDAQYQLARLHEANGLRLLGGSDWHIAALWLSEAMSIDARLASDGLAEHQHRLDLGSRRLANLWRTSPRLVQLRSFPSYRCHALTADGSLCIADDGHQCFVWDVATGEELYPPIPAQLASPQAISPDGQRLLAFDQRGVRAYDLRTGELLTTCGQRIPMLASWACDGQRIVALNLEGVLCIWDAASGELVAPERDLGSPPAIVRCLFAFALSASGERLAVAVAGRQVPVIDLNTGAVLAECPTQAQATGVAFSGDGRQLATQSDVLQVWDVAAGRETARLEFPLANVLGYLAAFSPDGSRLAFGDGAGMVRVRDLEGGDDVFPPLVHGAAIQSVAFSPEGRFLVTAAHDATVRLWDATSGLPVGSALRHDEPAAARFSADGDRIVTATRTGTLRVWESSSIEMPTLLAGHTAPITSSTFSRDGRRLVTGGWGGSARVWDVASGAEAVAPLPAGDRIRSISQTSDGRLISTLASDGRVRLWDAETGLPLVRDGGQSPARQPEPVEFDQVNLAEIGPRGRRLLLARGHRDGRYGLFDTTRPIEDFRFVRFGSPWDRALGARFDAAGRRALVYSHFGSVHVVDAATHEILLKRPPKQKTLHPDVVWAEFGADDEVLVALKDGTIERWRVSTGERFASFVVNLEPVRADVNAAGDRLVIAGRDHTVRVWDVAAGQPLTPPAHHAGPVLHVALGPGGESFVTASADRTARVWDTATGQPITPFLWHAGAVRWADLHPNGRQVATSGDDGIVRLWPLAVADERPVEELLRAAQLYASRRIEPGAGTVPLTGQELERLFQAVAAGARK
jgi:WD40 repeat protein/serine/threonine protein kinase